MSDVVGIISGRRRQRGASSVKKLAGRDIAGQLAATERDALQELNNWSCLPMCCINLFKLRVNFIQGLLRALRFTHLPKILRICLQTIGQTSGKVYSRDRKSDIKFIRDTDILNYVLS